MTIGVIGFWEVTLRPPFFAWVDARYPGDVNSEKRWNIKQRTEHFFISFTVDALVVTLLLRLVHRQQRQLRESEERYRALFEQARDGIGVVRLADHRLVEANDKFCEILGLRQQDCAGRDIRELFPATTANDQPEFTMVTPNGHSSGESELTIQTPQGQKERISGEFAQTKDQIIQYMQEKREQEATLAFTEQLRRASVVQINLSAPESPVFQIATDDQPSKGNANALCGSTA